ncbi:Mov34/MPN/PAD-1 family protein [uncultured Agrobacterium sp.]|uniref:Mov34/MPN/PAD-1 family protein n=1 Tax=uncultured Agrobacterium sp. TaxID=157277 RepID=UPI0026003C23|nr:Mov34/MPN/PAD-1 family protein [uncultured Agrobacterium sp.]
MREPIEFREGGIGGASIWVSPAAIASIVEASRAANRIETGGILIGRYGPEGWVADIVEATPKPKGSRSGLFWFQRSSTGLTSLLNDRWSKGLHYLGEWHSHPGGSPTPSSSDVRAMLAVADDEAYRCVTPLLVILGGRLDADWSLSVTLFRAGHAITLKQCRGDDDDKV